MPVYNDRVLFVIIHVDFHCWIFGGDGDVFFVLACSAKFSFQTIAILCATR
jgi:hypothetical protein